MHHIASKPLLLFFILPLLSYTGVLFLLSPHITHAAGNTYYVSKQGNDSNSCSSAQNPGSSAKLTISAGIACLKGGDTLLIQAGVYTEGDFCDVIPNGTGVNTYTKIDRYQNDVVRIRPTSAYGSVCSFHDGNAYIEIAHLIMDARDVPTANVAGGDCNSPFTNCPHHIRFLENEMDGAKSTHDNSGALTSGGNGMLGGTNIEFIRNDIHDALWYGLYFAASDSLIEGNTFRNGNGYAIHMYSTTGGVNNNIVRNNAFYNNGFSVPGCWGGCQHATIITGSGSGHQVYNNVLYDNWSGIQVGLSGGNIQIYNNTVANTFAGATGVFVNEGMSNVTIRNNIVYPASGGGIVCQSNNCPGLQTSNNLTIDPNFVNAGNGDFHLTANSPAIDTGVSLSEVPTDFEGTSRPQGGAYDIGADEYGAGGGPTPTPTPTPTGGTCTQYTNQSQIPQGFAVPWDVTNPSIMLVSAQCTPPTLVLKAGNPNTTQTLYVYKTGYVAPSGGSSWSPVDLFGSQLISQAWYPSSAQGVTNIPDQTLPAGQAGKATYYVAYTCTWTGSKWMCGCRDSACTQSYWQLQKIQQ